MFGLGILPQTHVSSYIIPGLILRNQIWIQICYCT